MDPNEQEADENLIKANEVEVEAEAAEERGNGQKAEELTGKAVEMKEDAEQGKVDSEAQIHEGNFAGK